MEIETNNWIGAIEFGGTKCICASFSNAGELLANKRFATTSPQETLAKCVQFFKQFSAIHGNPQSIGIAAFGPIQLNPQSHTFGQILQTPKPGWQNTDMRRPFFGLSRNIFIHTDVTGAALAEYACGAAQGKSVVAYITVGTGIGVGILHLGQPVQGITHYEMGHLPVPTAKADDFGGICPFHGPCIEGMASGPAIAARWGSSLQHVPPQYPALAIEAHYLACLCTAIIFSHAPEIIVMGGGVMKTGGLLDAVRVQTKKRLAEYASSAVLHDDLSEMIVPAALGDDAGIFGAFELAKKHKRIF